MKRITLLVLASLLAGCDLLTSPPASTAPLCPITSIVVQIDSTKTPVRVDTVMTMRQKQFYCHV